MLFHEPQFSACYTSILSSHKYEQIDVALAQKRKKERQKRKETR